MKKTARSFNYVRNSWFCNYLPLESFVPKRRANAATSSSLKYGTKSIRYVAGVEIFFLYALTITFLEA